MRESEKEYLNTKEWQYKRIERLKLDNFRCCRCGSPHDIQVHHTNYKNLGYEDVQNDLITLCDSCHVAIEKEIRSGHCYSRPINMGSNYGIKNRIDVPIKYGLIYTDLKDSEPERQLQFAGGKIRLCNVHLSYNDLYKNRKWYDEDAEEDGCCSLKGTYEDYQYELNNKKWYVFVEQKEWVHTVISNVMTKLEIRELNNGIVEIYLISHCPWEAYTPLTKKEHDVLIKLLDKCEQYYQNTILQN